MRIAPSIPEQGQEWCAERRRHTVHQKHRLTSTASLGLYYVKVEQSGKEIELIGPFKTLAGADQKRAKQNKTSQESQLKNALIPVPGLSMARYCHLRDLAGRKRNVG
jgi:hypothetical protein